MLGFGHMFLLVKKRHFAFIYSKTKPFGWKRSKFFFLVAKLLSTSLNGLGGLSKFLQDSLFPRLNNLSIPLYIFFGIWLNKQLKEHISWYLWYQVFLNPKP